MFVTRLTSLSILVWRTLRSKIKPELLIRVDINVSYTDVKEEKVNQLVQGSLGADPDISFSLM